MNNIHPEPFEDIHPNPSKDMLDELYTVIACFKRMQKKYKINTMDTSPAFVKKVFGPFLLNKRTRTDEDIRDAVEEWCLEPPKHIKMKFGTIDLDALETYGHISQWDVSRVTDMSTLFEHYEYIIGDISKWDVSNVTNMRSMFRNAWFNKPIGGWDVSKVTDMSCMFEGAILFNQPIGNWDVSNVTDMSFMFCNASSFNHPIGTWNIEKVTTMSCMFNNARDFEFYIDNWKISFPDIIYYPVDKEDD